MTHERSHEIFTKVIAHFGPVHQMRKCVEELTELSLALQHYLKDRGQHERVVDELADVFVTCAQMVDFFGEDRVEERIDYKEKRLLDTMSTSYQGEPKSVPTDEQLEHAVTVGVPCTLSWIEQPESVYEKIILDKVPDMPKKGRMPYFDGIGDEYDRVLSINKHQTSVGQVFDVSGTEGDFVFHGEFGEFHKDDFYPVVPLWRILKVAEEDKTLVVTVWLSQFNKFEDLKGSYFSSNNIYGLRRIEAVDDSCESKTHRIMKKLSLKQDAAEALIKQLGWAIIDHILSLEDRPL